MERTERGEKERKEMRKRAKERRSGILIVARRVLESIIVLSI